MSTHPLLSSRVRGMTPVLVALGLASCAATSGAPAPLDSAWLDRAGALDLGGSALVIHSAGLDEFLSDPRDAGLRQALGMLDERLLELPGELGGEAPPPGTIEFLCEALGAPWTLRVDLDGPDPLPIRAEWVVRPGSPERASALAARCAGLLAPFAFPSGSAENWPGLTEVELPAGSLFHGTGEGGSAFVLAWGEPRGCALDLATAGLPAGVRPTFALGLDLCALLSTAQRMASPEADEEFLKLVAFLGLQGDAPLRIAVAAGHDDLSTHVVSRTTGWVPLAERTGGLAAGPIPPAALDLVPRDARLVSISRSEPTSFLRVLEMLGEKEAEALEAIRAALGIELGADLLEPLGQTFGLYLSDTTGGGDLASAVVFAAVDDAARLTATLDALVARLNAFGQGEGQGRVRVRTFEHGAARGLELDFPGLPVPLAPALALHDGFLLAAATPQALVAALDWAAGGSADDDGGSPDWRQHLPRDAADLQGLFYLDTPRLARHGYGMASLFATALANGLRSSADPAREPGQVIPPLAELLRGSRPSLALSHIRGQDLVTVGTSGRAAWTQLAAVFGWVPSVVTGLALVGSMAAGSSEVVVDEPPTAEELQVEMDMRVLSYALESYAAENSGRYPDSLEALVEPNADGFAFLLAEEFPLDPWGNSYVYERTEKGVRVRSYGADGVPGGEGLDSDISSDDLGLDEDWEEMDGDDWTELEDTEEPAEPEDG